VRHIIAMSRAEAATPRTASARLSQGDSCFVRLLLL
jgi:hypothetical protein